jgi:uncharacterized protein with ParB-like and HNH nuclease domain
MNKAAEPDELYIEDDPTEDEVLVDYEIATYPADYTLNVLQDMWENKDITIPDFQRNFVWDIKQSSLLIESFLLGLPVPQVFFYSDDENKNLIIDGQQRILSVLFYFDGYHGLENLQGKKQVFRLQGLDPQSPYSNKRYEDLDDVAKRKLRSSVLRAVIIRQLRPTKDSTSIYHIFERLNTGGTALKPQEIRNCVFRGELAEKLKQLNQDANWRKILGKKNLDKHQKDVELILRLFALCDNWRNYEKPMKEFLNKTMKHERKADSKRATNFFKQFPEITRIIVKELGEKPFHVKGPLNSSALDSVFCTIYENVSNLHAELAKQWDALKKDKDFQEATYYGTSDVSVLKVRFNTVLDYLVNK